VSDRGVVIDRSRKQRRPVSTQRDRRGPAGTPPVQAPAGSGAEAPRGAPTLRDCYAVVAPQRSRGFLFSSKVSDRLGTMVATVGLRLGAHPTHLTLCNLLLGAGGSMAVMVSSPRRLPLLILGVVLWQLAYVFDCADGPLARATGKTGPSGASIDLLVDFAVQVSVVTAVSRIVVFYHEISSVIVVLFGSAWFINFVTFLLSKSPGSSPYLPRHPRLMSVVDLGRDYGFVILVMGIWLVVAPRTLYVPLLAVTGANLAVLLLHIARDARRSVHPGVGDAQEEPVLQLQLPFGAESPPHLEPSLGGYANL